MPQPCAYFRGEFMHPKDARIGIMTHALHYGTGTFAGINATWDEEEQRFCLFRIQDHYRRQLTACKMLRMELPHTVEQMAQITMEAVRRTGYRENVYCRPVAYKSTEFIGVKLHDLEADWFVVATLLPPFSSSKGLRCCTSSWIRVSDSQIPTHGKITGMYVNSALAKTEANESGFDDGIMLTADGHVSEAAVTNIFLVRHGRLVTPSASDSILLGITRDSIMRLADQELGIGTDQRTVARSELYGADEAFFTGTYAGVVPIVEIDRRTVGSGEPGPVALALQSIYQNVAAGRNPRYRDWYTFLDADAAREPVAGA
jgi:branched-chain amino acid aminotransferase